MAFQDLCSWNSPERILKWVAISFSRGSSQPRYWTCVSYISCLGRQILYHCITWKVQNRGLVQFSCLVCPTLCDPVGCSTPGLPVHHQLPEFTQTHVHWVGDTIQPSHPLPSPSPPDFNLSQHRGHFKWVSYSHQVAKVLEFQFQHQSLQWIFTTDFFQDGLVGCPWTVYQRANRIESTDINSL